MSRLISLTLSKQFGVLQAQEVNFSETTEGLIEVKAGVGSGKTTLKQAGDLALSAGNAQTMPFDASKYKDIDVEIKLTYGEEPVFMRTYTDKKGKLQSVAYIKTDDGKVARDPVIKGKKLTPAVLRDTIRTDLTFGIDEFLSEDPRTHMSFMMKIYEPKLKALGVVFDTKSPDYVNSILWRLEQAKMDRQNKHFARRAINAFKEALVEEGWDEENVPKIIDIAKLEEEKKKKEKGHYADKDKLQEEISALTGQAAAQMAIIKSYNDNLITEDGLRKSNLRYEIDVHNQEEDKENKVRSEIFLAIDTIKKAEYPNIKDLESWLDTLPALKQPRNSEEEVAALIPLVKVPTNEEGKITPEAFSMKFNDEVDKALLEIKRLKSEIAPKIEAKNKLSTDPTEIDTTEIDGRIAKAKENNLIVDRWNAFFAWQESDENVKTVWREYQEKFTELDLGVPGLTILVVGDEENSSIRTHYNGQHNPEFFGNTKMDQRLLTQYSSTQRPVIAILMQIYLLEEKMNKKQDGLRLMWVECPIDKKTRDLLIDIQKKYNLTIIVGVTGDFTVEGLEDGQFLIENGVLLTK